MASPDEQGDHDGLVYYLQRTREFSFSDVKNTTLPQELSADHCYKLGWESALSLYSSKRSNYPQHNWDLMEKECFVAVICYTLVYPKIGRKLNRYCRAARPTAESWDAFPYKSLFFFLIEAFEKLPPFEVGSLYRGVDVFEVKQQSRVPFVQFVSASVSSDIARRFGRAQLILTGVPSSAVRDIRLYAVKGDHKEVLIWPFCTFDVVNSSFVSPGSIFLGSTTLTFRDAKPSVGQRYL